MKRLCCSILEVSLLASSSLAAAQDAKSVTSSTSPRFTKFESGAFTTLGGMVLGGGIGYLKSHNDPETATATTLGNALIGGLTGLAFSWWFYNDDMNAVLKDNAMQRANIQLLEAQLSSAKLELSRTRPEGESRGGNADSTSFAPGSQMYNLLSNLSASAVNTGEASGLNRFLPDDSLKNCAVIHQFTLGPGGFMSPAPDVKLQWIPVDEHWAILSYQFFYSQEGCFRPHPKNGFFKTVWPEMPRRLSEQARFSLKALSKENENDR